MDPEELFCGLYHVRDLRTDVEERDPKGGGPRYTEKGPASIQVMTLRTITSPCSANAIPTSTPQSRM